MKQMALIQNVKAFLLNQIIQQIDTISDQISNIGLDVLKTINITGELKYIF